MKKLAVLLLSGLMATSSMATNWMSVGKGVNGKTEIYLDTDSVQKYKQSYISAFFQYTYLKGHEVRNKGWYYSKDYIIINCANQSMTNMSGIVYGFKDEVVDGYNSRYFLSSDMEITFPETLGRAMVDHACAVYQYRYNQQY